MPCPERSLANGARAPRVRVQKRIAIHQHTAGDLPSRSLSGAKLRGDDGELVDLIGTRLVQLAAERVAGILGPGEPNFANPATCPSARLPVIGDEELGQYGEGCVMVIVLVLSPPARRSDPPLSLATFLMTSPSRSLTSSVPRITPQIDHHAPGAVVLPAQA